MTSCRTVREWLHRDAEALADAERLVLEEHVQACAACRRDRGELLRLRALVQTLPHAPLRPTQIQRAISRALLETTPAPAAQHTRAPLFAILAGALGVAALAVWLMRDPAPAAPVATSAPGATTTLGVVERAGAPVLGELPREVALRAPVRAVVTTPTEQLELAPASTFRWSPDALWLDTGAVTVAAAPRTARFRVATAQFVVEVTGTRFTVTPSSVVVTEGTVRIVARDGAVLLDRLGAGETWTLPPPPAPVVLPPVEVKPPDATKHTARASLDAARAAFAAGSCKTAREHADAALDAIHKRSEAAEARTVLAECAQLEGRLDDAAAGYDAIATRFADLPAAQTALIARARLEINRGDRAAARVIYERYVKRYPKGRFAADARRFLAP